jgi:hypothetical protein
VIVTRGAGLQAEMRNLVRRFADDQRIGSHADVERIGLSPTRRQIEEVRKRVERAKNPIPYREAWVDHFVSDKFGAATTHWSKLEDRVRRGVGNPCPLVLIGLPASIVTFGESPAVVRKLLAEGGRGRRERRPAIEAVLNGVRLARMRGAGSRHSTAPRARPLIPHLQPRALKQDELMWTPPFSCRHRPRKRATQ